MAEQVEHKKEATRKRKNRVEMVPSVTSSHSTTTTTSQDHKCSVCLELFAEPKVLPCCHTFCLKCLKKTATTGQITCPICRASHKIPAGGLSEFLTDFIENYKAEVASCSSKSRRIVCGECDQPGPVSHFCSDCQNYLCNHCGVELHKRLKTYRGHKVTPIGEIDADTLQSCQVRYCSSHKGEALKLYCETCEELICRDCTLVEHRQHSYKFVQDARKEVDTKLHSLKSDVSQKVAVLKSNLGAIKSVEVSAQGHSEVLKADINEHFDNLAKAIEAQRTSLLQEAEAACQDDLKQVWADKDFHLMSLASISAAFGLANKALKCTNDSEMILTALQSMKQLSLIKEREWDGSDFARMVSSHPSFQKKGISSDTVVGNIEAATSKELEVSVPNGSPSVGSNFSITATCKPINRLVDGRSGKDIQLTNVTPSQELTVKVLYGKSMKELNNRLITVKGKQASCHARTQPGEGNQIYKVNIKLMCGGKHVIIFSYGYNKTSHVFTVQGKPQHGAQVIQGPDWKENAHGNPTSEIPQNTIGVVWNNQEYQYQYQYGSAVPTNTVQVPTDMVQVQLDHSGAYQNYKWGKDGEYEVELNWGNY